MAERAPNNIAQLLKATPYELETIRKKSPAWFEGQAFKLFDVNDMAPQQALKGDATKMKGNLNPGSMYFFLYDAKHKDTLPYYDMFPLVLPFGLTKGGFIGLNLHYLPYDLRIKLLWKLQDFNTTLGITPQAKMAFQWETIKYAAKFKAAKPCVKQYLAGHVRSPFRIIPPADWATAAMLPLERFSGSEKFNVWSDSLKKI